MRPTGVTLLLGGARSGKSALAVKLARASGRPVVFVATAEALDADMASRIARHRAERPAGWATVEEPLDVVGALVSAPPDACVVVDCLTLWLTNRLMAAPDDTSTVERATFEAIAAAVARRGPTIVVSNEVGLGVVPDHPLGRTFRDALGRVNTAWAEAADRSLFLIAGRVLTLADPAVALGDVDD